MKKSYLYITLLLFGVFLFAYFSRYVALSSLRGDSGFDSSWDSGSDWGGSDWDSDWGSDYDSGYGRGQVSGGGTSGGFILILVLFIVVYIIVDYNIKLVKDKNLSKEEIVYENQGAIENIMKEISGFNKEEFYKKAYDNFVEVQNAWMNFDYNKLRTLLTDELYNVYKSQLKTLRIKKQTNIMNDFELGKMAIIGFEKSGRKYSIRVKAVIRFYDYLVDKTAKVIRGDDRHRLVMTYVLTFVGSISKSQNRCPNCNAVLDNNTSSNTFPYCKSKIISNTHDFLLSKKEAIEQRKEQHEKRL